MTSIVKTVKNIARKDRWANFEHSNELCLFGKAFITHNFKERGKHLLSFACRWPLLQADTSCFSVASVSMNYIAVKAMLDYAPCLEMSNNLSCLKSPLTTLTSPENHITLQYLSKLITCHFRCCNDFVDLRCASWTTENWSKTPIFPPKAVVRVHKSQSSTYIKNFVSKPDTERNVLEFTIRNIPAIQSIFFGWLLKILRFIKLEKVRSSRWKSSWCRHGFSITGAEIS